ncbi:MAG TPA: malto-oligosyltrehalose synthase [Pirellulales bacterium]|jgi:(1->4)-alpha-D-glucan 1-alpha-D-glucosylmutase|nr:malto-oligosyltrehalose synthase [Pirellulales bacterium]
MSDAATYHPRCTYRLQLRPGFGFLEAAAIASYLEALGISHVYCSSYLQAAPGSTHGYDVLDHQSVNAELGGTLGHNEFCNTLGKHHLGQMLDVVPNHMSISHSGNRWWWDVLENGPSSRYAAYFDVDWEPQERTLYNRVLIPILGDHYGRVIAAGKIRIEREAGSFRVRYEEHLLPMAPRSLDDILAAAAEETGSDLLSFAADVAKHLPPAHRTDQRSISRRHRDKEILRRMLDEQLAAHPEWAAVIDKILADINASPDRLDDLLERQNYRLAFWRMAKQELDYRRFFDINTLVGLRMEDEQVFADTHALVLHWLKRGVLDGLRIDHPDGLRDPQQYCSRLLQAAPQAWIVAEKILMPDESLPEDWPIAGTTGYDFLNRAMRVFIDPEGETPLTEFYAEFTGESTDYAKLAHDKKHLVMRDLFASDLNRLTGQLAEICENRPAYRDYTRRELNSMLREVISCLSVYRTYVQAEKGTVSETDRRYIHEAIDAAKANRPDLDSDLFDFFRGILLLEARGQAETELVMRFQQSTGPVTAKGIEDTLFYCYNRFVALNEVGSEPNRFAVSAERFHRANLEMLARYPRTMLATTTHDTKRGEDVRLRLALLSEIPQRWAAAVRNWAINNERYKTQFQPDRNLEYLFYQTAFGAWPIEVDRLQAYLLKAARESKQQTSWTAPNEAYEKALAEFTVGVMADQNFCNSMAALVAELAPLGWVNSLAHTLLKLTSPGVPDIYQGSELWDLRLVDPDNRTPVDFLRRQQLLNDLEQMSPEAIWAQAAPGLPKLWLIKQALNLRKQRPELFESGSYEPTYAKGTKADHILAFVRAEKILTIVPRLNVNLAGSWSDSAIEVPPGAWLNILSGECYEGGVIPLANLMHRFPVALLWAS